MPSTSSQKNVKQLDIIQEVVSSKASKMNEFNNEQKIRRSILATVLSRKNSRKRKWIHKKEQ